MTHAAVTTEDACCSANSRSRPPVCHTWDFPHNEAIHHPSHHQCALSPPTAPSPTTPPTPNTTSVCDPVLGDEGKLYVSEELLEAYKTR